jgi:hypothetical protein
VKYHVCRIFLERLLGKIFLDPGWNTYYHQLIIEKDEGTTEELEH